MTNYCYIEQHGDIPVKHVTKCRDMEMEFGDVLVKNGGPNAVV